LIAPVGMTDDAGSGNGQPFRQSRGSSIRRFAKWLAARRIGSP
jgi:hypothetical protein